MTTKLKLILAAALFAVPLPAFAQSAAPPHGWDRGNTCAKDVTTEGRRMSDLQAYRFCRTLDRGWVAPACNGQVARIADNDPDLARFPDGTLEQRKRDLAEWRGTNCGPDDVIAAAARGYPPGDDRCTLRYQRDETNWEYWADDRTNCPNLRRPRR